LLYAPADVGQAGLSHLVARPNLFRRLPRSIQNRWGKRAIRAAGAAWLHPRCEPIRITTSRFVTSVSPQGGRLALALNDGTARDVDHVLMATGYRVNISKYPFLPSSLLKIVAMVDGYPRLNNRYESSLEGLHFLGAPAAWSFGPLMRFVAGADFATRTLTRGVLGRVKSIKPHK
jgi:hypothetical protein